MYIHITYGCHLTKKKNLSKIDKLITINIDHINVEEAAAFYDAFLNIDPSKKYITRMNLT